jgi:putative ABC transport system permease protein
MRRAFRLGVGPGHVERAVDDEIAFHLESRAQVLMSKGFSFEEAREQARAQFGNLQSVRDSCVTLDEQRERTMNRSELLDQIRHDFRHAFRVLRKARGMSTVAVVTLAVAIAMLTTVFSILNTGFLRPLPYPDADRLVGINARIRNRGFDWNTAPLGVVNLLRRESNSFERVAAYDGWTFQTLTDQLGSVGLRVTNVDTAILSLVGARAQRGRLFTSVEITGNAPLAIISDSLWRTRYGRDEAILGRQIRTDKDTRTIIGVLAPGFRFNGTSDIWMPLVERADTASAKDAQWYWLAAKLKHGVSVAQAQKELERFSQNLASSAPAEFKGLSLTVRSSLISRGNLAYVTMGALFALVAFCVYLIACSNVGNLLLVRASERRPEMAVRASLGASRARMLRQSLSESALLAAAAGVLGAVLSVVLLKLLLASVPTQGFPSWLRFGLDIRVFAFVALISLVGVAAFGLVPARHGARVNLVDALKSASDVIVSDSEVTRGSRRGVIVQIALSLSLFVASLFFARSYFFLARLDRGYDIEHVAYAQLRLDGPRYADASVVRATYDRVRERLDADGRIEQTALAGELNQLRLAPGPNAKRALGDSVTTHWGVWLPGHDLSSTGTARPLGRRLVISDEYFHLLRMSIVRGRGFGSEDVVGGQHVAVVSQRLAALLWGRDDPIGKTLLAGPIGPSFMVIGVASDVRDPTASFEGTTVAPQPNLYLSERQAMFWPMIYLRPRGPMDVVQPAVESATHFVDPEALPGAVIPLTRVSGEAEMLVKLFGSVVGSMAFCGIFLAMLGIYGVIAYGVTRRTREIGLRIALGARPEQVVSLFTVEAMRFTAIGLGIGVLMAAALSLLTRMFVYGTSMLDPVPYIVGAAVFGIVALLASWLAARRATLVEPSDALRSL